MHLAIFLMLCALFHYSNENSKIVCGFWLNGTRFALQLCVIPETAKSNEGFYCKTKNV